MIEVVDAEVTVQVAPPIVTMLLAEEDENDVPVSVMESPVVPDAGEILVTVGVEAVS